jgi:shikimate kinase
MRIYIVGVSCVGKSTVGMLLAEKFGYDFVDFDLYVEKRFGNSIERIKNTCFNEHEYRDKVKHLLAEILNDYKDNIVIAMPPGGLFRQYLNILKKHPDVTTVALKDSAENIMKRLIFTDEDSNLIEEEIVNDDNYWRYLREVKKDIEYFRDTHKKAKIQCRINEMDAKQAADFLAKLLVETHIQPDSKMKTVN